MKIKHRFLILAVLAGLTVALVAKTTTDPDAGFPGFPGPLALAKEFIQSLNLTEPQKAALKTIVRDNRYEVEALVDDLIVEKRALEALVEEVPVDEDAIRAQSAKVAAVQADLAVKRSEIHEQIVAILTPEQIVKIQTAETKMRERMDSFIAEIRAYIDTI